MFKLSPSSQEKLQSLDPRLQILLKKLIYFLDFTIVEGYRNEAKQNEAFEKGNSKLKFPESKHNTYPSKAVDLKPYPYKDGDLNRFYFLAGCVKALAYMHGVNIRWGGDWDNDNTFKDNNFNDLFHFEII